MTATVFPSWKKNYVMKQETRTATFPPRSPCCGKQLPNRSRRRVLSSRLQRKKKWKTQNSLLCYQAMQCRRSPLLHIFICKRCTARSGTHSSVANRHQVPVGGRQSLESHKKCKIFDRGKAAKNAGRRSHHRKRLSREMTTLRSVVVVQQAIIIIIILLLFLYYHLCVYWVWVCGARIGFMTIINDSIINVGTYLDHLPDNNNNKNTS